MHTKWKQSLTIDRDQILMRNLLSVISNSESHLDTVKLLQSFYQVLNKTVTFDRRLTDGPCVRFLVLANGAIGALDIRLKGLVSCIVINDSKE